MRRIVISLSLVGALGLGAAACGSSNDSTSATTAAPTVAPTSTAVPPISSTAHNDADVAFVEQMVPHHQQALVMASLALDPKAGASDAVKALATKIDAAQTPEIEMMQGWMDDWMVPMSVATDMHDMGGSTPAGAMGDSDGMMSDADLQALAAANGPAFDKLWLTGMIAHHQGAIAMATIEKRTGTNPGALTLADAIDVGQAAEVAEMQQLLATG